MKKNQGIFEMWLRNFVSLVFMQSFQAIFLSVALTILASVNKMPLENSDESILSKLFDGGSGTKQTAVAIVAFIALTGVIKLQKLVKGIFGIEDSPLIGDMSKNMKSVIHTAIHAKDLMGGVKGAWDNRKDLKSKLGAAQNQTRNIASNYDRINQLASLADGNNGNTTTIKLPKKSKVKTITINAGGNGAGGSGYTREQIAAMFSNNENFDSDGKLKPLSDQMLAKAKSDEMDALRDYKKAQSKLAVKALSTMAGLGIATGASDSAEETIATGATLAKGLDSVGNVIAKPGVNRSVRKTAAQQLKSNDAEIKNLGKQLGDAKSEQLKHNLDVINKAIVDSTKNDSTSLKQSTSNVFSSIRREANDWLGTQSNAPKTSRVSNRESKKILNEHREKYNGKKD